MVGVVSAQSVIPSIPDAAADLSSAIALFEDDQHEAAFAAFTAILSDYPLNATSSTARIMAAKAAFRIGRFAETRSILARFASDFPTSTYLAEASRLDGLALQALQNGPVEPLQLGVLLSLSDEDRVASQAMFNGIRMAVDDHNRTPGNQQIRMIYEDVSDGPDAAAEAVSALAARGTSAIVGTLYSEEAVAAAARAEEEEIVFIAPLATDERISNGATWAFQANASMTSRGEGMARFAVNGLRLDRLGIVTVADDRRVGERLSDGFIQSASALGAEINLIQLLPTESSWFEFASELPADTLDLVDAVYVPLATRDAISLAGTVLGVFERFGKDVRLLGNSAWHELPQVGRSSRFSLTYSNDYYPDLDNTEFLQFGWSYYDLTGSDASRLGVAGFDVTRFIAEAMTRQDSRTLPDRIRNRAEWQGFGHRIHFDGGNVNRAFFFHRYRDNQLALIR